MTRDLLKYKLCILTIHDYLRTLVTQLSLVLLNKSTWFWSLLHIKIINFQKFTFCLIIDLVFFPSEIFLRSLLENIRFVHLIPLLWFSKRDGNIYLAFKPYSQAFSE